jgi:hypothetical protein
MIWGLEPRAAVELEALAAEIRRYASESTSAYIDEMSWVKGCRWAWP